MTSQFEFNWLHDPVTNQNVLPLQPFIDEALEKINVAVDQATAYKVAAEMRKLGWICIPPEPSHDV